MSESNSQHNSAPVKKNYTWVSLLAFKINIILKQTKIFIIIIYSLKNKQLNVNIGKKDFLLLFADIEAKFCLTGLR